MSAPRYAVEPGEDEYGYVWRVLDLKEVLTVTRQDGSVHPYGYGVFCVCRAPEDADRVMRLLNEESTLRGAYQRGYVAGEQAGWSRHANRHHDMGQ